MARADDPEGERQKALIEARRAEYLKEHPCAAISLGDLVHEMIEISKNAGRETYDFIRYLQIQSELNRRSPEGFPDFSPPRPDPHTRY